MAGERTEKATPKKREEARKKGQVARSMDLQGATVVLAGLMAISAFGPKIMEQLREGMLEALSYITKSDDVVNQRGVGQLFLLVGEHVGLAALPVMVVCVLAGVAASVGQVGFAPKGLKPDFKKINPASGLKNMFGPNSLVEALKNVLKVALVGGIAALALFPKLHDFAALVGTPPGDLLPQLAHLILGVAQRGAMAYLLIGVVDYVYQRYRHEKSLRMDKQEVKDEYKQQGTPAEVKSAQRRRALELARGRMMEAVPTADVIVTNPTHYSVALKYESGSPAPIVVAKGVDHLAFKIREIAADNGVMVVPDPPLARTLYGSVDVGKQIPEDLFHAVAQLLAYVYRIAGARRAA